jgi:quercetin dioxygenase-like cupin family protein
MIGKRRVQVPRQARAEMLSSTDVQARPWRPFSDLDGVRDKVLWEDPLTGSYAGIMELAPDAGVPQHFHLTAAHHLYVIRGTCELAVSDRVLGPGAYAFVPAEALHGVVRAGPEGCTMFFLHLAIPLEREPAGAGPEYFSP